MSVKILCDPGDVIWKLSGNMMKNMMKCVMSAVLWFFANQVKKIA